MTEGYVLFGVGKKYIDECRLLVNTLRKQNDNRPVSIVTDPEDREYAESMGIFDKFIDFQIFDQDIWKLCKTKTEKYIVYPRLFLDKYIQYDHNMSMDSDIICQAHTEKVWKYCKERKENISQLGFKNDSTWHWGTVDEVSEAFGKHVPHTHCGLFYIRRDEEFLNKFFTFIRETFYKYDEYKCKRMYQDGMTEEIIFAIAHAQFDIDPVEFDQVPVMTHNITPDMVPTRIFTLTGKEMPELIPFVHMFVNKPGSEIYNQVYDRIMNTYFSPIPV